MDPGLSVHASEALCRKVIDFSSEICAAAVVLPGFEEALWEYCGKKEIRMLVETLPEREVPGLCGIWDLSAPGAPPEGEKIGHVRVSDSNMDPELLAQRLRMLRQALRFFYAGIISRQNIHYKNRWGKFPVNKKHFRLRKLSLCGIFGAFVL